MNRHRAFNKSYIHNDSFVKISQEDRLYDEISYYQMISGFDQKKLFAEFRGNKSNGLVYALELKNYDGFKNLAEFIFDSEDEDEQKRSVNMLLDRLKELHHYPLTLIPPTVETNTRNLSQKMLLEKTHKEYEKFCQHTSRLINGITKADELLINDSVYENFHVIWPKIQEAIYENSVFDIKIIHGDCCFANILVDAECQQMIFVDPRGSYGLKGCFGDPAYDYAKILHSLSGNYEQIIYDMFNLSIEFSRVKYSYKFNYNSLENLVRDRMGEAAFRKAKLIEGLIFIGMCARHYDSEKRQAIMYCTGVKILNEWLKS